jgi:hypothetical protein
MEEIDETEAQPQVYFLRFILFYFLSRISVWSPRKRRKPIIIFFLSRREFPYQWNHLNTQFSLLTIKKTEREERKESTIYAS